MMITFTPVRRSWLIARKTGFKLSRLPLRLTAAGRSWPDTDFEAVSNVHSLAISVIEAGSRDVIATARNLLIVSKDVCISNLSIYTQWPKKLAHLVLHALTSSNIDRFSNPFHCQNQENICNNNVTKDPTTPQVCRYTTSSNVSVLKATIKNKTTSVSMLLRAFIYAGCYDRN